MKVLFSKIFILLIVIASLVSLCIIPASAVEANPTIRVGLYYGTAALPAANLMNAEGSGFNFGYFNGSKVFVSCGYTSSTNISILKDRNMYGTYSSQYDFYDTLVAGGTTLKIGAYHYQYGPYSSFAEASSAAASYSGGFPAYISGKYYVRVGSYTSNDGNMVGNSSTCYTVVDRATGKILFEFDYGTVTAFGIMPDVTGVSDPITWFKGYTYRGGFEYKRISGNDITVINYVSIDDYAKGILPYEMSNSWPVEALKAQCLAAKSYTLCNLNKHSSSGFDLCNTTDCQVYRGTSLENSTVVNAVEAVSGQYVLYNGSPAECFYYSSNGGASEDAKNVWGTDVPYLKGVLDNHENYYTQYSHTFTPSELKWLLNAKGYSCSDIVECYVSEFTSVGNVYSVTMVDSNGKKLVFSKESARNIFYSQTLGNTYTSQRFNIITNYSNGSTSEAGGTVYVNGVDSGITSFSGLYAIGKDGTSTISGSSVTAVTGSGQQTVSGSSGNTSGTAASFTVKGTGLGHNVGMSQYGAYSMAKDGWTAEQIIKFYYTGVTIGR